MTIEIPDGAAGCGDAAEGAAPAPCTSEALLRGHREIVILHRGSRYVLRQTRQGGLILNRLEVGDDDDARR